MPDITGPSLVHRPLGWRLGTVDVLRLVRDDAHPVALSGAWAHGGDLVAADPVLVRSAPGSLGDVLDAPPAVAGGAPGSPDPAFGGGWIGYLGYSAGGEALPPTGPRALPAWWFGYYDHVLRRDRATGEWHFEALCTPDRAEALERRLAELTRRAATVQARRAQAGTAPAGRARSGRVHSGRVHSGRAHSGRAQSGPAQLGAAHAETAPAGADSAAAECDYAFGPFRLIPGADRHQDGVRAAVEYIHRGDIFQANITLRAEAEFAGDPLDVFCQGVTALDPPYAAFVGVSEPIAAGPDLARPDLARPGLARTAVVSLSPELFLRRAGRTVTSKPIKGTARRAADRAEAAAQRAELEASAKNRAENVMIVDLVRNDLSRVCLPGSVTVPVLLGPEPHPGVWHLVSTVTGTLNPGAGDGDLIRAAFPPGSVTGAPKVRALEIIDELEAAPREVYTGAVGYRSPVAGLELNVAIRTFEFAAGRAWLGAGGGIVADSDPAAEYAECLIKATPLLTAVGASLDPGAPAGDGTDDGRAMLLPHPAAGVFTSLLVTDGETRGLAAHLARLESSVRALYAKDLPASLPGQLASCLARRPAGRLRITVRPVGGPLQVTVEVVPLTPPPARAAAITATSAVVARSVPAPASGPPGAVVTLRPVTVPGGLGAHKYRDRRLLADLASRQQLTSAEQLLLTDETGELLETDRANVFAVIDGVLLTPPADGRLLPGTTRAAALRAAREHDIRVGQKPLTLDELAEASEVFVTNAVAGVLPVSSVATLHRGWEPGPVAAAIAAALAARPPDSPLIPAAAPAGLPPGPPAAPAAAPAAPPADLPAAPAAAPAAPPADPPAAPAAAAGPAVEPRAYAPEGLQARRPISPGVPGHAATDPVARGPHAPAPGVAGGARGSRPLVVLIDNYDSFTWNLAHLLDAAGAVVEVVRNDEVTAAQVVAAGPAGVVISPGPCAPAEAGISIAAVTACAAAGVPLLGICLGHQAIGAAFGAGIIAAPRPVHGTAFPVSHDGSGVLAGLPRPFRATRYHSLVIDESTLPPDLLVTARTDGIPMAVRHAARPVEGVQFHPESILTTHGAVIMTNFVISAVRTRARQS